MVQFLGNPLLGVRNPRLELHSKIQIAKLNVDDSLDVSRRFDVMSIPTLILFKDGEPRVRLIGAKPKGQLLEEISAYL